MAFARLDDEADDQEEQMHNIDAVVALGDPESTVTDAAIVEALLGPHLAARR